MPTFSKPYAQTPEYQTVLRFLQLGEWAEGLQALETLNRNFPHTPELQKLLEETQIRSRIDEYEAQDKRRKVQKRLVRIGLRVGVVVVLIGVGAFLANSYYAWAAQTWKAMQSQMQVEVSGMEASVTFRQAQNLLAAGRYKEAESSFLAIQSEYPDFPNLQYFLTESQQMLELDRSYEQANNLIQLGDLPAALAQLEAIEKERPAYRNVQLLIADVSNDLFLKGILEKADNSAKEGDWPRAIADYETIVSIDPDFETELIKERRFNAYIEAAKEALAEQSDSLKNLELAEGYYQKALALRPQDPEAEQEQKRTREIFRRSLADKYIEQAVLVLSDQGDSLLAQATAEEYFRKAAALLPNDPYLRQQRDMAGQFLVAQDEFVQKNWDAVIESIEPVFALNPNYALGTARLTLFEAYMQRGKIYLKMVDLEEALTDFKRAGEIAATAPFPLPLLYASRQKTAETYASLGNYEMAAGTYMMLVADFEEQEFDINRVATNNSKFQAALGYMAANNYRTAYRSFKDSLPPILPYSKEIVHLVEPGEYLVQLANLYQTTVETILTINQLQGVDQIVAGKPLIMPLSNP